MYGLVEFWAVIEVVATDRQGYLPFVYHIPGPVLIQRQSPYRASWLIGETMLIKLAFH